MRYARSVLITLIARAVALPIGIVSSVITARYLGPSGRGVLVLLTVLQGLAIQFGSLGFNGSIVYFISRNNNHTSSVTTIALTVAVIAGVSIAGVFALAARLFPYAVLGTVDLRYLDVFLIAIPFGFFQQFLQNVLLARQRIVEYNALDIAVRTLQLAAFALVLTILGGTTMDAVLCVAAVTVVSGILYFVRIVPYVKRPAILDSRLFRQMISYGGKTYVASLLMFLAIRLNLFIVNSELGESASGLYSIAMQIADLTYLLPITLGAMLFPRVSSRGADETDLTAKTLRFSFVAMSLIGLLLFVCSEPLIRLLYGAQFAPSAVVLQWYVPGIVALSLVMILNNDLAGRGLPNIVLWGPIAGLMVNATASIVAVRQIGIAGAAIASSLCYLTMLVALTAYYTRVYRLSLRHLFWPYKSDFNFHELFR